MERAASNKCDDGAKRGIRDGLVVTGIRATKREEIDSGFRLGPSSRIEEVNLQQEQLWFIEKLEKENMLENNQN